MNGFVRKATRVLQQNGAFTLVEVMITLILITFMLSVAMPLAADALAHYQTVTTVRKLVSDIQYTQQLATRSEDPKASFEIIFSPPQEQYTIKHGSKTLRTEKFPVWVHLAGTNFGQPGLPEILTFNIQGNPVQAGTITIINRRSGKVYYVRVAVLTGRVRVESS
ncbi:hypothetical protein SAMN02745133_00771 [Desulforamulus putei DSM 12395]|uniref:Prepilin-type N-terminal cleavage/methylation domain-containing protein n=1 Tax=Desulforamulus putei DSM 12395 TaxID=1121429 RepID=A0A1M4UVD0_9FIRM|nr:prepilin-type N-terminal cleavage/methylation domain-containing protein [Desulforamulus putei]SHE60550.1 hypothetical protein SAMN02745133_00771 [Desulforamulus putei DSM 12395]